eukprot:1877567-Alexandrium_andersonii.AAC.1
MRPTVSRARRWMRQTWVRSRSAARSGRRTRKRNTARGGPETYSSGAARCGPRSRGRSTG